MAHQVYRRRAEFVVAEDAPAGGTISTRDGVKAVGQGDKIVQRGGDFVHYTAADFGAQFEPAQFEELPEDLQEIHDPERVATMRREREEEEKRTAEREERASHRAGSGKTTKARRQRPSRAKGGRSAEHRQDAAHSQSAEHRRDAEAHQRNEERRQADRRAAGEAEVNAHGDSDPQPTQESQRVHNPE